MPACSPADASRIPSAPVPATGVPHRDSNKALGRPSRQLANKFRSGAVDCRQLGSADHSQIEQLARLTVAACDDRQARHLDAERTGVGRNFATRFRPVAIRYARSARQGSTDRRRAVRRLRRRRAIQEESDMDADLRSRPHCFSPETIPRQTARAKPDAGDVERTFVAIRDGKTARDAKTRKRGRSRVRGGEGAARMAIRLLRAAINWAIGEGLVAPIPARMSGSAPTAPRRYSRGHRRLPPPVRDARSDEQQRRLRSSVADAIRVIH